jgi:hypothetical protein
MAVDGGLEYLRRVGDPRNIEDLSTYDENVETNYEYPPRSDGTRVMIDVDMNKRVTDAISEVVEKKTPVFLGKTLSDTEVVVRLAAMDYGEFERAVKWGKISLINKMFGLKPGELTRRARRVRNEAAS